MQKNIFKLKSNYFLLNKNIFYKEKKLKYKNSNHFTESFGNPILKPILDFNYYISDNLKKQNLFQNKIYQYLNLSIFQMKNHKYFFQN